MARTADGLVEARCERPGGSTPWLAAASASATRLALAVADVNWFSTEHLFRSVADPTVRTLLLHCQDYRNAWEHRHEGSLRQANRTVALSDRAWLRRSVLPPGWMKRFPRWGMRPLARSIRRWRHDHAAGAPLGLVITYPYYLALSARLRPDRLVYYNIDDYTLYWPECADAVRRLEREAVLTADLTVCVSLARCRELREAVPEAASRIRHLPHGTPDVAIAPEPLDRPAPPPPDLAGLPRPILGYFGSLEDRVDWELLDLLAVQMPGASLVLVGRVPEPSRRTPACQRCLSRPNVRAVGWRTQAQMLAYTGAFDVCLIPYRPDHPFNRACCPTKILDYLGTGRPIVSTALPECLLHTDRLVVACRDAEFVAAAAALAESGGDGPQAAARRHAYALDHRCEHVAATLLEWLDLPPNPATGTPPLASGRPSW
jgi:hypothetical protein